MNNQNMRIAHVFGRFPVISEPFIRDQITDLIARGHDVGIYAFKEVMAMGLIQGVAGNGVEGI